MTRRARPTVAMIEAVEDQLRVRVERDNAQAEMIDSLRSEIATITDRNRNLQQTVDFMDAKVKAADHETFKATKRLDATLYAMVLMQDVLRKNQEEIRNLRATLAKDTLAIAS